MNIDEALMWEKLVRIEEQVREVKGSVKRIDKNVSGNGQPGLNQRMNGAEEAIATLEGEGRGKKVSYQLTAMWLTLLLMFVALIAPRVAS